MQHDTIAILVFRVQFEWTVCYRQYTILASPIIELPGLRGGGRFGLHCSANWCKAHDRRPKFSVQETRTRNSHEKLGPIYAHKTHKNLTRETWRLMIQTKTLWQSF